MQLTPDDQATLRAALGALSADRPQRFEDLLWLGFGDGWVPMTRLLARHRYITLGGSDKRTPAITDRGGQLLGQLRAAAAAERQPTRMAG